MPPKNRKRQQKKEEDQPDDEVELNPDAMTVAQLKAELGNRGLDITGKKAQLTQRLKEALETDEPKPSKKLKIEKDDEEEEEGKSTFSKAATALRQADAKEKKKRQPKVDTLVPISSRYSVVGEYDCMLNQTNIGQNNNKFYIIQLLTDTFGYNVWTRWGRVGEPGQNAMKRIGDLSSAEKEFRKKFKDKTKNDWDKRDNFTPQPGKYTLLDMGDDDGEEEDIPMEVVQETDKGVAKKIRACTLDKDTMTLVKLLFDNDMFKEAMQSLEIDTKKMPLGKLSKTQIAKGFEALEEIEAALASKESRRVLSDLTSKFYTIIPHSFGRTVPPVITDAEHLQKKFDLLSVLGDIEIAQSLQKKQEEKPKVEVEDVPHPLDVNYMSLKAKLEILNKSDEEYKIIEKYLKSTECYYKLGIQGIWRVDRDGEGGRFSVHDSIENRRLLWHGTNVAVVAAILKTGLRIMPHSGGRVGRGIYFASENNKSAGYVGRCGNIGIMFLGEVALGKEYSITQDDSSLKKAPEGYDSVVARGRTEPDPTKDTSITIDGKTITVPQGAPLSQPQYSNSYFSQSEYLIYQESQVRLRYLLKLKF